MIVSGKLRDKSLDEFNRKSEKETNLSKSDGMFSNI